MSQESPTLLQVRCSVSSALLGNVWALSPATPWLLSFSDLVIIIRHEEGMATTPGSLPGESPQTEEPGGLQSAGSQRVRHD